jgi:hypothetical protein
MAATIEVVVVLPCGAADRHRPFEPHQLAQHLGAAHHRQQARAGGQHLGIVLLDRARHDHDLGVGDVVGAMADRDLDADLLQPARVGAIGDVAALHLVAEIVQHLGDARHADAADADEVDQSEIERHCPHAAAPVILADQIGEARRGIRAGRPRGRRGHVGERCGVSNSAAEWPARAGA